MKIFFDENFPPQLPKALTLLQQGWRDEKVEVFHLAEEYERGLPDEVWIPKIAKEDGIVITRDLNIQKTRQQRELYKQHRLGVVFFKTPSKTGYTYWEIVVKVVQSWSDIKITAQREKRPFAYILSPRSRKLENYKFISIS